MDVITGECDGKSSGELKTPNPDVINFGSFTNPHQLYSKINFIRAFTYFFFFRGNKKKAFTPNIIQKPCQKNYLLRGFNNIFKMKYAFLFTLPSLICCG